MSRRPKYPKTDTNHTMVADILRRLNYRFMGTDFHLIDTSKSGGNLCDYLLICGETVCFLEVKTPEERDNLTDGEKETQSWGVLFFVVTTPEEVIDVLYSLCDGTEEAPSWVREIK